LIRLVASLAVALLASGCDVLSREKPPPAEPPGPPPSREVPPEIAAQLPTTQDGKVLFTEVTSGGLTMQLAYDPTLDDPITRWGWCLSRVTACVTANPSQSIIGCIPKIEVCASSEGGHGCCPSACLDEFRQAHERTRDDRRALEESILTGRCIPGFPEAQP